MERMDGPLRARLSLVNALQDPSSAEAVAKAHLDAARKAYLTRLAHDRDATPAKRRHWPERKELCAAEQAYVRIIHRIA